MTRKIIHRKNIQAGQSYRVVEAPEYTHLIVGKVYECTGMNEKFVYLCLNRYLAVIRRGQLALDVVLEQVSA